jgi:hypothetical protein
VKSNEDEAHNVGTANNIALRENYRVFTIEVEIGAGRGTEDEQTQE